MNRARFISVTPQFTKGQLQLVIAQKVARIEQATLDILIRVGEQFVTDARSTTTYKDVTGNLRSSIGYVVLKDGKQLVSNFQQIPPKNLAAKIKSGGKVIKPLYDGRKKGEALAKKIASEHPIGFCIVGVAGMQYSISVEARGFDVITGSSITAQDALKNAWATLQAKVNKLN